MPATPVLNLGFPSGSLPYSFPSASSGSGARPVAGGGSALAAIQVSDLPTGLSGGDFVLYYNSHLFTVTTADVNLPTVSQFGSRALDPASQGWNLTVNANTAGQLVIGLSGSNPIFGDPGAGVLATVNFHINNVGLPTIPATSFIDLAQDTSLTGGPPPATDLADQSGNNYNLALSSSPPQNNATSLSPYVYGGSDPNDGSIIITDANKPPIAVNDAYTTSNGDTLAVPSPGILVNDNPIYDDQLMAAPSSPFSSAHGGTVTLNSNGSFVYTAASGYVGPDSFTYTATDPVTGLSSSATVNLTVTPRLSLPNLVGNQGGTVVVPVMIDNPNPPNSGGLTGAALAIDYNSNVFTVSSADVQLGSLTSTWNLAAPNINTAGGVGEIDLALSSAMPITTTAGGSLVLITFHINPGAPAGLSQIIVNATNNPSVNPNPVTTRLDTVNLHPLPISPGPVNNTFVAGLDGSVYVVPQGQATHFSINAPANVTAGVPFNFTVTALDGSNHPATGYTGTVAFSTSDPLGSFGSPSSPLTAGIGTFTATLLTLGSQTLTATDTTLAFITGASNPITVGPAIPGATHFVVTAPTAAVAGLPFTFTVIAETASNTTATGYAGTVTFSSSDSAASFLPISATLVGGQGVFNVTLRTAGIQTLTAVDALFATVSGASNGITVSAASATHFAVSAQSTAAAGSALTFTVTAKDQFNNIATGYTGTVHFTTSDPGAATVLPPNSLLANGVGTFSATLTTAGNQTLTATDPATGSTGTSNTILITGVAASHFVIETPTSAVSGTPFVATVIAEDQFNNAAPSYSGTVNFTSSDPLAFLPGPPSNTLTNGQGMFPVSLQTGGLQTLTVTDGTHPTITGASNPIAVGAGTATHFAVSAPTTTVQGTSFSFTVMAEDAFNNTATGYAGTVGFTSTDHSAQAKLPGNSTLAGGIGVFSATLTSLGSQTLTATDTSTNFINGASNSIAVAVTQASHFTVTAPTNVLAGTPFAFTVTAETPFNNTATTYAGFVSFTSTDLGSSTVLPVSSALVNGVGTFTATLTTAGMQTVTATDQNTSGLTGIISGTSDPIVVGTGNAAHFVVSAPAIATAGTPFIFTVTAQDLFNNTATGYTGIVGFSSSDTSATFFPATSGTLTGGSGTFIATLRKAGIQTLTATDTSASSIIGASNPIAVSATAATHFGVVGTPSSVAAGGNVQFAVTAEDPFNNTAISYTGIVHFTSSDPLAGPLVDSALNSGVGLFNVTLKTVGNQTLTVTDTITASIAGASNTIVVNPAAASQFVVSAPATAVAGTGFKFTVTAEDAFNNTVTGYSGTVGFSSSDLGPSTLPGNSVLNGGVGIFSATLVTAGNQKLTATDTSHATMTGSSGPIAVSAAAAAHFAVGAAGSTVAGSPFLFSVTAQDPFNNVVTSYNGIVHFGSTDGQAALPSNATLTNGAGLFAATLKTAGSQFLSATDTVTPTITGKSGPINVSATTLARLAITVQGSATAGTSFDFTVTAQDQFHNTVAGYSGTLQFNTSDSGVGVSLPANSTLAGGVGVFFATLTTEGLQTLTAADTVNGSITPATATLAVTAANATHFAVSAPAAAAAGIGFNFTVKAEDQFNNTTTTYAGVVNFSSSDTSPGVSLPGTSPLSAGVGTFTAALATAGNQTLAASDSNTPAIKGSSNTIAVGAGQAARFAVVAPANAIAGAAFNFTVLAEDAFNNPTPTYSGTVTFSSTDTTAGLPANNTLTGGAGTFSATLTKSGIQMLKATDVSNSSLTATSNPINVSAAAATRFVVSAPATVVAGSAFSFTVTARDQYGNTATGYAGTVAFTTSDHGASTALPPTSTLAAGIGTFAATLTSAGTQTITATDTHTGVLKGASGPIAVSSATTVTHFVMTPPVGSAATAGNAFAFLVQAEDQFNNQVTGYGGTVHFSSSDEAGTLPANATLLGGFGAFVATFRTVGTGTQTLTCADTVNGSITPATATITLSPNVATHFLVTPSGLTVGSSTPPPGVALTGNSFVVSVAAADAYNNTAVSYHGTVHFTSSDNTAVLPGNGALTSGAGSFSATLNTVGNQTLTVTDAVAPNLAGTATIAVRGLIVVSMTPTPTGFVAGFSKAINPSVINLYDSADAGYGPADVVLKGPVGAIRGSLLIDPTQTSITFVKTSTFNITSVFNPGTGLLPAGQYTLTLRSASNGFEDTVGNLLDGADTGNPGTNFVATFSVGAPPVAVGVPAFARGPGNQVQLPNNTGNNISMTNGIPINLSNGAGVTSGTFTLTYNPAFLAISKAAVDNQQTINFGGTVTGGTFTLAFNSVTTGPISYSATVATLQSNIQTALSGLSSISAAGGVVVSAVNATSVDVNFLNSTLSTQAPLSATNSLTGAAPTVTVFASTLPPGSTLTLVSNNTVTGIAVFAFSTNSASAVGTGPVNLGALTASIPSTTQSSYGAKALLHFSSELLSGTSGPIAVINDDAVQAVAYLGEVSGDGAYSPLDAALIARVATGLDSGFAAYARLDPVIVGNITTSGSVTSTDASLMNRYLAGFPIVELPGIPEGVTIAPAGPDPTLSVPTDLQAVPGSTVVAPVDIDTAKPDGSTGMMEAVLAVQYDPQVFTVSPDDIQLGTVPESGSGWHLTTAVNAQTGEIGIDLFSTTPVLSTAGGSLVTISLHVRDTAPAGVTGLSLVPEVSPSGPRAYQTEVSDAQGAFVLHPAVTAAGTEPGLPGQVTIASSGPLAVDSLAEEPALAYVSPAEIASVGEPSFTSTLDVQHGALQASVLASANSLPLGLVEQVFADLEQAVLVVQENVVGQPGPVIGSEWDDRRSTGARGLALLQALPGAGQGDWMSEDYAANFGQTALRSFLGSGSNLLDKDGLCLEDEAGLTGLEAFLARGSAGIGNRSRPT